jgi:hypothetical protein
LVRETCQHGLLLPRGDPCARCRRQRALRLRAPPRHGILGPGAPRPLHDPFRLGDRRTQRDPFEGTTLLDEAREMIRGALRERRHGLPGRARVVAGDAARTPTADVTQGASHRFTHGGAVHCLSNVCIRVGVGVGVGVGGGIGIGIGNGIGEDHRLQQRPQASAHDASPGGGGMCAGTEQLCPSIVLNERDPRRVRRTRHGSDHDPVRWRIRRYA